MAVTQVEPNPLQARLAAVRQRLRFVVLLRGLCRIAALILLAAVLGGLLDWRVPGHLPGAVRALLLAATLGTAGYLIVRLLVEPLRGRLDDLSLALRVEELYPALNDSLASTVEFLHEPSNEAASSASLRQAVVLRTLQQMRKCNVEQIVNTRGVTTAGLAAAGSLALAVALVVCFPAQAWTALVRLANPFGAHPWPTHTQLRVVDFKQRAGRGEPYEIHCEVAGVVPETGSIEFDRPGLGVQTVPVAQGRLVARLDHVEQSFRFQVRANDAATDSYEVEVLPPPQLTLLDGRASPQVRLLYPPYTDLAPLDLPDGTGSIDAVAGTFAVLRAATDRPVVRAWIDYQPDAPLVHEAAFLAPLAAPNVVGVAAAEVCTREVWDEVPVRLDAEGRVLTAAFPPRVNGTYTLHFEDETGLGGHRRFNLHVFADPAPEVNLRRPSASRDQMEMLPDADVSVQVAVEDKQFAVRSVFLEYRCGQDGHYRSLPLYEHGAFVRALPGVLAALAATDGPTGLLAPAAADALPLRLRPTLLHVERPVSLRDLKHEDGSDLREGDILRLRAGADDFDDVAFNKQPGRSHEVELRIVGQAALQQQLDRAQKDVQQELLRVRKMQQEALGQVIPAEQRWRDTGKLERRDIDKLIQAEQLQQQIRGRIGTKEEGLRADVDRVLRALRDNHLPADGTRERMGTVADELDRLARRDLSQIEPQLTAARKSAENTTRPAKPRPGEKGPLGEARRHQEEVENTLNDLLRQLEPWGNVNEARGEARDLLHEQRQLLDQTKKLDKDLTTGQARDELTPEQQARLDEAAELQRRLGERAQGFLDKTSRVARQRQEKDPDTAKALAEAAEQGRRDDVAGNMKVAADNLRQNQLNKAQAGQEASARSLEEVVKALENRREEELNRLHKKLKEAQDKLDELTQRQERLRKKMKDAMGLADPKKREQELKRLARQQEQLRKEAQEMVKRLSRLRAEGADQALSGAAGSMEQAGEQLTRGQDAEDAQEETLDRLNEARRRLDQAQRQAEEELAREKLAKVADQLKRLRERQDAAVTELVRLEKKAKENKGWTRGSRFSLADQAAAEEGLAKEARDLAESKLTGARVFSRILGKAATSMDDAGRQIKEYAGRLRDDPDLVAVDPEIERLERQAARRLGQLVDALKNERGLALAPKRRDNDDERGRPSGQDNARGGPRGAGDGIPPTAELKLLHSLQEEVNQETEAFDRRHPDPKKLNDKELKQLQTIKASQQEVAELLDEWMTPPARSKPEGEKK